MLRNKFVNFLLAAKKFSPLQMAQYAKANTRFYNRFYEHYPMKNFRELPLMSKYDLVGISPYDLLSKPYQDKVHLYAETSGSSGAPTPSFFTPQEFQRLLILSALSPFTPFIQRELKLNRVALNGLTFGFTIAGFSFGALLQKLGALVAQVGSRSTIAMPERTVQTIIKLRPSVIAATPLDFMSWMEIVRIDHPQKREEIHRSLKFLMSTAESCAKSRQRQIENFFNVKQINVYASVDGFVSIPCPCGEKHLIDHLLYIELYDPQKNYLGTQGTGRLCFTNLVKKSTPIVKFLLDDLVTIRNCHCPYGFRQAIEPHGRYELSMDIKGRAWGHLDFEEIIYTYGLFMDYRVEVLDSKLILQLEEYPSAAAHYDLHGLEKELSEKTALPCDIHIQPLGSLTNIRKVRSAKSIVKVLDKREKSTQEMPCYL
jgi:phenylacetate-CoA ligase